MKKLVLLVVGLLLFSFILAKPAQAFSTPEKGYQLLFEQAVFQTDDMNLQSFVYEVTKAIAASTIINPIIGCLSCEEGEGNRGIIAATGFFITGLYTSPPASGVQEMTNLAKQIGIVQPVYAQEGQGFQNMMKIMPVWKAFRNISYVFFILIFIFVGFAIMFRMKINPQTVVSIQSALPKIILALILVTFSYAIVGFMLDLMWVLLGLTHSVFLGKEIGLIRNQFGFLGKPLTWLEENITTLIPGAAGLIAKIANSILLIFAGLVILVLIFIFGPISWIFGVIATILVFIAVIRCLWTLLKAYALIIINLIFAPFLILIGALPGSNAIGTWFKNLLANILVLPAMFLMFYLSIFLIFAGIKGLSPDNLAEIGSLIGAILIGWTAVPIGAPIIAIVATIAPDSVLTFFSGFFLPIIGLVILLMAPKVADLIKSFITQKPFEYGTAIGEAFGPVKAGGKVGFYYGAETGIQVLEEGAVGAGRTRGWDVTAARVGRKLLGLKK